MGLSHPPLPIGLRAYDCLSMVGAVGLEPTKRFRTAGLQPAGIAAIPRAQVVLPARIAGVFGVIAFRMAYAFQD